MVHIHQDDDVSIFFGNAEHAFQPAANQGPGLVHRDPFQQLVKPMALRQLVFLRQTHSKQGRRISAADARYPLPSFVHEGDYLLTNVVGCGIGVSTADCLPVVLVDKVNKAVAIIHAGWRGAAAGIVGVAIQDLQTVYGTQIEDVRVFFGPSAKECCYEVGPEFVREVGNEQYHDQLFLEKNGRLTFSISRLVCLQLASLGIKNDGINKQFHVCTICSEGFCSVRNTPGSKNRQMSVVALCG